MVSGYCLAMVMGFECQGCRCELVMEEHRASASAGMVSGLVTMQGLRGLSGAVVQYRDVWFGGRVSEVAGWQRGG